MEGMGTDKESLSGIRSQLLTEILLQMHCKLSNVETPADFP